MNVIDIGIIIFILFGALTGFKRGFTKEVIKTLGFIAIVVLAYFLKNPLSIFFYEHLPFLKFGIFKGIEVLNILFYEILAFIIVLSILGLILKLVLFASTIFEKLLNATIILGIPSKILGAIVGLLYHYIICFVILYVITLTCFDLDIVKTSKYRDKIVNNTPILSNFVDKSINVVDEFIRLKEDYEDKKVSESEFNYKAIELFLKYDLVNTNSIEKLVNSKKISSFDNLDELLNKYKGV